jgi:hypothetical protein
MTEFVKGWATDTLSQAVGRLETATNSLDPRTSEILTYHTLVRREIEAIVADHFPSPKQLVGLGFMQQVSVLAALLPPEQGDWLRFINVLRCLDKLRNAAAHPNANNGEIDACLRNLHAALYQQEREIHLQGIKGTIGSIIIMLTGLRTVLKPPSPPAAPLPNQ